MKNPAQRLEVRGLRGFASLQALDLAVPTGTVSSGLTIIVGANSAGKSTVIEAFRALAGGDGHRSFPERVRNIAGGSRVELRLHYGENAYYGLRTVSAGGSETEWTHNGNFTPNDLFVVSPRRAFSAQFGRDMSERSTHLQRLAGSGSRPLQQSHFAGRLFRIQRERDKFDFVLKKLLDPLPNWYIEQGGDGNYFLRIENATGYHDSDGLGDGIASLFVLADALYDSKPSDLIVIDEPELSLHPSLQRRLFGLLQEYAADRQIVLSTHSPYLVDPTSFDSGTRVARCFSSTNGLRISQLDAKLLRKLAHLTRDINNPHTLGINAREALFQEDSIILLEGQEDVQLIGPLCKQAGVVLEGSAYGWGVGGADKMETFAEMFHQLGYRRVVGILDANKPEVRDQLRATYPEYFFDCIAANDIRTKKQRELYATYGLLDEKYILREEFKADTASLINRTNGYLSRSLQGKYLNPELNGSVTFDYSSNNGIFRIGIGELGFDTKWSNASNTSIHIYSDAGSLVAVAHGRSTISEVNGEENLDFSSRAQTPRIGDVVILKNGQGYFAALRIEAIEARSHADERDQVRFTFQILRDKGSRVFSAVS
jgi:predicted ATPase